MTLRQKLLGWKYQPEVVDLLLAGTSKDDLEILIAGIEDLELGSPELDIARMNLIGGLRSWGVQIPKKRGWYHITGFVEPRTKVPAEEWRGEARETLDWVHTLPGLTPRDAEWVRRGLEAGESTLYHERSLGYVYCYEAGARGVKGFLYSHPQTGNRAVVVQRFVTQPRLKVFQLNLEPREIIDLSRRLAPASVKPVRLLNVGPKLRESLKGEKQIRSSFWSRQEALYDCEEIAKHPERFWSKRGMTTLRKGGREIEWRQADSADKDDMRSVVQIWKEHLESRHRQLACGRDFVAIDLFDKLEMEAFIGFRDGRPVCIQIFSGVEGTEVAALIVEKSLNYKDMPGGKYGTADRNLYAGCRWLADQGYRFQNAGGLDGGGVGLSPHKERFSKKEDDVYSWSTDLCGIPHKETEYYDD